MLGTSIMPPGDCGVVTFHSGCGGLDHGTSVSCVCLVPVVFTIQVHLVADVATTSSQQPAASSVRLRGPAASSQQPATSSQQPAASGQQPAAEDAAKTRAPTRADGPEVPQGLQVFGGAGRLDWGH